jgi:hypothetical protein
MKMKFYVNLANNKVVDNLLIYLILKFYDCRLDGLRVIFYIQNAGQAPGDGDGHVACKTTALGSRSNGLDDGKITFISTVYCSSDSGHCSSEIVRCS